MQTAAPDGYLLPDAPKKIYFYFSNGEELVPAGWENALDLTESFSTVTVNNNSEKTRVPVIVTWGLQGAGTWPDEVHHVKVDLYRSVGDGDPEAVEGKSVTLDASSSFDNYTFTDLPVMAETTEDDGRGSIVVVRRRINYSLVETIYNAEDESEASDITNNYAVSEKVSGTGWHVVRNQAAVSVDVEKQWYQLGGEEPVADASAMAAVKYDLYRSTKEISNTGVITRAQLLSHLNDADAPAVKVRSGLTLEASSWSDAQDALSETDSSGKPYYYFVLEDEASMPQNHEDRYMIAPASPSASRTLTIRNIQTPVTVVITPMDCSKSYGDADPEFEFDLTVQQEGANAELTGKDETTGKYHPYGCVHPWRLGLLHDDSVITPLL